MKNKTKSFTLIELIVVVIILGILAAIAIPMYTGAVEQRKGEACINNMKTVFAAWRIYNMHTDSPYLPSFPSEFITVQDNVPTEGKKGINSTFNILIDERNFGTNPPFGPGYYFGSGVSGTDVFLYLWTYRLNDIPNKYIACSYYYKRTSGVIYDWETNGPPPSWPWLPPDE